MLLDTQTKTLELRADGTATTSESQYIAEYRDISLSSDRLLSGLSGVTSGANFVTMVPSPPANTLRDLISLSIVNSDTVTHTYTVVINDSGTRRTTTVVALLTKEELYWQSGVGFYVLDVNGARKTAIGIVSLETGVGGILPIANGGTAGATPADARTNLGLGTAAVKDTGTSGNTVPLLDGGNTWSSEQRINANVGIGADDEGYRLNVETTPSATTGAQDVARIHSASTGTPDSGYMTRMLIGVKNADGGVEHVGIAASNNGTGSNLADLVLGICPSNGAISERARITAQGFFKASDAGNYSSVTGTTHELRSGSGSNSLALVQHTHASDPYGFALAFTNASPDNNNNYYLHCSDSTTSRLFIYSDGDLQNHDNSYGGISARKLKQDITDYTASQWEDFKAIRLHQYRFKTDVAARGGQARQQLGVIADELRLIMPGLVRDDPVMEEREIEAEKIIDGETIPARRGLVPTGETTERVVYSVLNLKMLKVVQELMARVEVLEAQAAAAEAFAASPPTGMMAMMKSALRIG